MQYQTGLFFTDYIFSVHICRTFDTLKKPERMDAPAVYML